MRPTDRTRRRVLAATGTGLALGLAGCSGIGDDGSPTGTGSPTATAGTESPTATESTANGSETESETATEDEGPGYKTNHWHGRLFFEADGELVDFHQPKYFLKNIEDEDAVYFHFHEDPENHGPNEWSNEKQIVTFQKALNLLPGIGYEQKQGEHVVTYEGTTYDATRSGTSVSIHRDAEAIDPTSYEVQHRDYFWVQATSQNQQRNAATSHGGADVGTLLFDINNHRVDFSKDKYVEGGSGDFHFHSDGNPYMWYKEGSVTLAEGLNALEGIAYERRDGNHVVTYEDEDYASHSREFDGGAAQHDVRVRQRTEEVDPTSYEPSAGDIVWIYVKSDLVPENEH